MKNYLNWGRDPLDELVEAIHHLSFVLAVGQGIPVVPKSDKIAAQVAESDYRAMLKKMALDSYSEGIDTALDGLKMSFEKAIEAGHDGMLLADALKLIETFREICKTNIAKA